MYSRGAVKSTDFHLTLLLTRCRASPTLARPTAPLAACVQRISSVDNRLRLASQFCIFYVIVTVYIKPTKLVAVEGSKTDFIYSSGSVNPANLAKIGPVDFEIICPTEIVENK